MGGVAARRRRWQVFLATTAGFGALTYVAVGGTRAYLVLAFVLFVFIGLADGYIKARLLAPLAALSALVMFGLALGRYRLDGSGAQQVYNFLFLTRDTLSPWENLALILQPQTGPAMPRRQTGLPKITGTRVHDRPVVGWSGPCRVAQSPNSCRHTTVGVSLDMSCGDAVES
jgi:WzyE protein